MDVTVTNRNRICRVVDGYTMIKHKTNARGDIIYWRCTKHNKCNGRGTSDGLDEPITMTLRHNHLPDPVSPEKRKRKQALKEAAAANRTTKSSSLASDAHEGLSEEALQAFPSQRNLQQSVNLIRKIKNAALADKAPDELELPDELTLTLRGERFLLVDSRNDQQGESAIFAFASAGGLQILRENPDWSVDGTFFSAPKYFDSLVTLNAFIGTSAVPAVYILLRDRRKVTYARALDLIFSHEEAQGIEPRSFVSDFEIGLIGAFSERWGGAEERLCFFHFCKALFVNIQKKQLLPLYAIPEVRSLLRCFGALAVLPTNEVVHGYTQLCAKLKSLIPSVIPSSYRRHLNAFAKYFTSTYIGREHVRGRPSSISVREQNLRALVVQYSRTPIEERDAARLDYLRRAQYHLSPTAFERLLELETENTAPPAGGQPTAENVNHQTVDLPESSQTYGGMRSHALSSQSSVSSQPSCSRPRQLPSGNQTSPSRVTLNACSGQDVSASPTSAAFNRQFSTFSDFDFLGL